MNSQGQAKPSSSRGKISQRRVLQSFEGRLQPISTSFGYGLGLVLVALMLVLLLGVYLAVIGLAGYWTLRHLSGNSELLSEGFFGWLLYLGGAAVGAASVFFLIKPLFSSEEDESGFLELQPHQQPVLFRFCARVAQVVGAPEPTRILVSLMPNAGASLGRGLGAVFGKQLCLHIGLPLVRVLTVRQLAGVLAHEMGHFSQHWGMRLGALIRATCYWLLRVAYERDQWDEYLERMCSFEKLGLFAIPAWLARLYIAATRWLLRVLAWIGVGVAAFFTRQMEYEADLYEAQLVGSRWFVQTMKDLWQLQVGHAQAVDFLHLSHHDRRLAVDFPEMVQRLVEQFRKEEPDAFEKKWLPQQRLSWDDTHPTDPQRIRAVQREGFAGLFRDQEIALLPARVLFVQFGTLCRQLTEQWYRRTLPQEFSPEWLRPVEEIMQHHGRERTYSRSLERYCQGGMSIWWFLVMLREAERLPLSWQPQQLAPDELAGRLRYYREQVVQLRGQFNEGVDPFQHGIAQRLWHRLFHALAAATLNQDVAAQLKQSAHEAAQQADQDMAKGRPLILPWCRILVDRLQLALGWAEGSPQQAHRAGVDGKLLLHVHLLRRLMAQAKVATELFLDWLGLQFLLQSLEEIRSDQLQDLVWHQCERLAGTLENKVEHWIGSFGSLDYPLDEGKAVTVADWLVQSVDPPEELPSPLRVFLRVDNITDRFGLLLVRILSRCCSLAERVEQAVGLPPLPEPPQDES